MVSLVLFYTYEKYMDLENFYNSLPQTMLQLCN